MRLSSKIMILLAVAIVGVFLWGFFSGQLPAPLPSYKPRTTTPTSTTTTQVPYTPAYRVNQPFIFGSVQYEISKVETVTELQSGSLTVSTDGSFVLVFMSVLDLGTAPFSLSPSDFILTDITGRFFTLNQEATNIACLYHGKKNILTESLQPGLK